MGLALDLSHEPFDALKTRVHALHRAICAGQLELLRVLGELERREAWESDGAYSMAHWVTMELGISYWKADRWVDAGVRLDELPVVAAAFRDGDLPIDKVVELTRFAEVEEQDSLVDWAEGASSGAIRREGELRARRGLADVVAVEAQRSLDWGYDDDGKRFWLEAELPAAQGAVVASALDGLAREVPAMSDDDGPAPIACRRADALVALCSGWTGATGSVRAEVVVHVGLEDLLDAEASATVEGGSVIPAAAVRRLLCNADVRTVIEAADGTVAGHGRLIREPSSHLLRQLRHRDQECRFPGCGARRFTHAHHIHWWSRGGRTDLDNLVLICGHHHRLVHEHGWRVEREPDGDLHWFRPDGTGYRAGPAGGEVAA